jgi:hypothetical protein
MAQNRNLRTELIIPTPLWFSDDSSMAIPMSAIYHKWGGNR